MGFVMVMIPENKSFEKKKENDSNFKFVFDVCEAIKSGVNTIVFLLMFLVFRQRV